MKVNVLKISHKNSSELFCMVNIKSLKNYKKLLKIEQYFIFGGHHCKCSFKEVPIKELYKYQLPYEHFILAVKTLEENLQYKTKNLQTNNTLKEAIESINRLKSGSTYPNAKWLGEEYRIGLNDAITEITKLIK